MYVNNAKVSMVLPATTTNGNKQFLYPIGKFKNITNVKANE